MKARAKRWSVPGALALAAACSPAPADMDAGTDAGHDAGPNLGPCPKTSPVNPMVGATYQDDAGFRYICLANFYPDGGPGECQDRDKGNPCPICCVNPREADGGRQVQMDGGPACFC